MDTTNRAAAGIVSFSLLNEPDEERARVLRLLDGWFDRWLASPA